MKTDHRIFWKATELTKEIAMDMRAKGMCVDEKEEEELFETILSARGRIAPFYIEELDTNEVFVFGSDLNAGHVGRAAQTAMVNFGAKDGGEGLSGRSYAIATTDQENAHGARKVEDLRKSVETFVEVARKEKDRKFILTRLGAGYARIPDKVMGLMFKGALALKNVYLPQSFVNVLFDIKPDYDNPSEILPLKLGDAKEMRNNLKYHLALYMEWVRNKCTPNFLADLDCMERLCNGIMASLDYSYRGLPFKAYEALKDALEQKENGKGDRMNSLLNYQKAEVGQRFYRMRVEPDNWERRKVDKMGMFHIPYSLRHLVKTQRYSVPGVPSLYLSEHVYGCWEELGRPNLAHCLTSSFKNMREFVYLDLTMPSEESWYVDNSKDNGLKPWSEIKEQAMLFPLVMACSCKSHRQGASFKPEYVIPQLVLQYVKEHGYKENLRKAQESSKVGRPEKKDVYGIKYTSVNVPTLAKRHDPWKENRDLYDNYVLPVLNIDNEHCKYLDSMFTISEPISDEYQTMTQSISMTDELKEYYMSRIGLIELTLGQEEKR